ncbi:autotransporter family protein [Microvirga roseola]|uniref:autotransporter family protein n=1 Tax=Microvirga roseola TaxID=2883126 RepID=UPI0022A87C3E|nr:autotransporter domain-containing protein [Microvirga roseola]
MLRSSVSALTLLLVSAGPVVADDWIGGTGDWFLPGNWQDNSVPTSGDLVNINNGTVQIQDPGAAASHVVVGDTATGALDISNGGTLDTLGSASNIGQSVNSIGSVVVSGPGSTWNSTSFHSVGFDGTGTMLISNGGTVTGEVGFLGSGTTGSGTVTVTGAGSRWIQRQGLAVGYMGTGELTISDGGFVSNDFAGVIGFSNGSDGAVTVTGSGSTWNITGRWLSIAESGTGQVTVANGGKISAPYVLMATGAGSQSTLTLTGNDLNGRGVLETAYIEKGAGTATLNFNGGILRATADEANFLRGFAGLDLGSGAYFDTNGHQVGISTVLNGNGRLTKLGAGTLTLSGTNTFTGGTTITSGTLIGSERSFGSGTITNHGALIVDQAVSGTMPNAIDGTGTLTKKGSGTLTLSGTNTFTGGTTITSGTLIGSERSFGSGTITNHGALIVDQAVSGTMPNAIDGTGTLTKKGSGTLTLSGTNTFTGGTTITSGTLIGSERSFGSGTITNHGALIVDQAVSGTMPNAIDGTGTLTKKGSGTLTLSGTSGLSGATTVEAGHLAVNGSLGNSIVTLMDGSLGGTGTVGGIVVGSGATVAPGNSIGTLKVAGDVAFRAGSVYQVEVNATGQADQIAATGAATLTGGTVQVLAESGSYQPTTRYTVLTATGGVNGSFAGVNSNFAFLDPTLTYSPNEVILVLARKTEPTDPVDPPEPTDPETPADPDEPAPTPVAFHSVAVSPNQYRVADAVEALGSGNRLFNAVIGQSVAGAQQAFDALSGEAHASGTAAASGQASLVRAALGARLRQPLFGTSMPLLAQGTYTAAYAADKPGEAVQPVAIPLPGLAAAPRYSLWGEGFGSWGKVDGNTNAAGLDSSTGGFILGADTRLDASSTLGIAGGFSRTTFDVNGRVSSGSTDSIFAALYGSTSWGNLSLRLGASYAWNDMDVSRTIRFPGFTDSTHASYDGYTALGFAELGYRMDLGAVRLEPFVSASVMRLHTDGFQEEGGAAALTGYEQDQDLATTTLGLRAETRLSESLPLILRGLLGWRHTFGDVAPESLLAFAGGESSFAVQGTPVDRDALVAEAGLDWRASDAVSLGVLYSGQVGERAQEHSIKGSFTWRFGTR